MPWVLPELLVRGPGHLVKVGGGLRAPSCQVKLLEAGNIPAFLSGCPPNCEHLIIHVPW